MPLIVPDPPAALAVATAAKRRRALQEHLATQVESALAVRAFRELPDRDFGEQPQFLEGPVAAAEIARLRWQLQSTGLLLLERAADLLEATIARRSEILAPGSVAISLEPLPANTVRHGKPPWRVVVCAPETFKLREVFEGAASFLGIGVYVVYLRTKASFRAFSRCAVGLGGLDGVVGGVVRSTTDHDRTYLVTCAHVIADGCGSLMYPPPPPSPTAPDAVLLRPTGCFRHPDQQAQEVLPAGDADTARLQLSRAPLVMCHPDRRRSRGWLKYPVAAVIGPTGQLIRFPHYSVQPFRYRIAFLRWPPFRPHFAGPGDSGSWVVEESTKLWLGMVVGGHDDHSDTLVADGRALVDYYSGLLTGRPPRNGTTDLVAFTWA